MKISKQIIRTVAFAALCIVSPLSALADEEQSLKEETPASDVAPAAKPDPAPNEDASSKHLFGNVSEKRHKQAESAGTQTSPQPAAESDEPDLTKLHALFDQRKAAGQKLSAEDYRSLDIGVAGYESYRPFFQPIATITDIYPGSPADEAGLVVGDKILVDDATDQIAKDHPHQGLVGVNLHKVGSQITLNVYHEGKKRAVALTRTNFEDIKTKAIREKWEKILRNLGYPQEGAFIGKDINSMQATPQDHY